MHFEETNSIIDEDSYINIIFVEIVDEPRNARGRDPMVGHRRKMHITLIYNLQCRPN